MRGAMLFAVGLVVGLAVHVAIAQNNSGVEMMNHVAFNVPNIEEAVTYYTQKMGYREAFRANNPDGTPRLVYMQISRNTFMELQPASAPQRPAGFSHYGLVVNSTRDAVARFRKSGLTVSDPTTSDTKAVLANIADPYVGRIELAELTPESSHYKAIQSWK